MGRALDIYKAAIAMGDLDENEATDSEFLAKLYEQAERRVRSAETTLERRNRSAQKEVTDRIKERRELYTDLADIRSREKQNALDNITTLKKSFQDQQGKVFTRRPDAGRVYIERAKYQKHVGPQGRLKALTKSISAPGDVPAGSRVSDFEFGDFWHSVINDPAFGLSEDSQGNLVFPAGMTDSVAMNQLKDMHTRAKRVDAGRESAMKSISEQVDRLDALQRKLEGTSGDRLNDQELNEVNAELKDATKNVRDELDKEDRKVGDRAREDLDDYLEDDEVYQNILGKIGKMEASQKKSLPITSERFLEWARARGMRVGQIGADEQYIPGRDDNAALAAYYVEMKKGNRPDGTARYVGGNPRTGEIVTVQYLSDDIERVRADDGQVYMREDGTVINPAEIRAMRQEIIEDAVYSRELGGKEYAVIARGGANPTVEIYGPDGLVDSTTKEGNALQAKLLGQRGQILYTKDENGDLKYADLDDFNRMMAGGKDDQLLFKEDVVKEAKDNKDLAGQLDVLDPSKRVPEGVTAMSEADLKSQFTVTETAFVLAPNANDVFNNPGKTRYRLMDGTEIVRDDSDFLSKETVGNVGKSRATLGEVARHLNDERMLRSAERRAGEDPRGWFKKIVDGSVMRKKERADPGGEEQADPGEVAADKAMEVIPVETEEDVISKTYHYAGPGTQGKAGQFTAEEIRAFIAADPTAEHLIWEAGFDGWTDYTEVEDFSEVVDLSIPGMEPPRERAPEPAPEEVVAEEEVEDVPEAEEVVEEVVEEETPDAPTVAPEAEPDTGAAGLVGEDLAGDLERADAEAEAKAKAEAEAAPEQERRRRRRKKPRGVKDPTERRRLERQEAAKERTKGREAQPPEPEPVDPMAPAFSKETIKGILQGRGIDLMSLPGSERRAAIEDLRGEFEADPKAFQDESDMALYGPPESPQSALEMLAETGSTTPPQWNVLEEGVAEPELAWGTGPDPKPAKKTASQRLEESRQRREARKAERAFKKEERQAAKDRKKEERKAAKKSKEEDAVVDATLGS